MTTDYTTDGVTTPRTAPGAPENIRADIQRTRADLGATVTALTGRVNPRARLRGALSNIRTRSASGVSRVRAQAPRRARQVQQAVRNRPVPVAVAALTAAGAVAAVVLGRRRAVKARSARGRRLRGLLHR
ncbi:DUF3618 domain-containing protein [Actinoplanes sp. NPDC049118]|uniref:DUF3618 domain-containing protein n=1 Tax=Actinoplanes sp. NPDC049118 TaxID=3155769 RepID=UPI0033EC16C2